jgi:hypothetical protein
MIKDLQYVQSRFLELHPIIREDIPFIYDLRTQTPNNFLNPISSDIAEQYAYYEKYLEKYNRGSEIYYKILDKAKKRYCGVVRLTEIDEAHVFNWQSLVVAKDSSPQIGIDIMLVIYSLGFENLNRSICGPWPVDLRFKEIFSIHKFIGMTDLQGQDENFASLVVTKERFLEKIGMFRARGLGVIINDRSN